MDARLDHQERTGFERAVRGGLAAHWPSARHAATGDLARIWEIAVGAGWLEAAGEGMLGAMIAATRVFGALACPFPLMDGFIAARLFPELAGEIAAGRVRAVVTPLADGDFRHVEAAPGATHLLVFDLEQNIATLRSVLSSAMQPGTAAPGWSRVTAGAAEGVCGDVAAFDDALALLRLCLAARVLAAAERAHQLAVEHAGTRRQFGRLIGAFGAVQQRIAACHIDVAAGGLLVDRAVESYENGAPDWQVAAEIAVTFIAAAARRVQLGAHHTLAASGFFEEHEAPWLFRRVHADAARLVALQKPGRGLGDLLVEAEQSLPKLYDDPATAAFRAGLRQALDAGCKDREFFGFGAPDEAVVATLVEGGYLGMGWPRESGGREASAAEQTALLEELHYRRLGAWQTTGAAVMLLGEAILRHGSEAQKTRFLPLIRAGQMRFCLGYSEAEAGSDLASLRTCAVQDGGEWVIDGQKLWTSGADHSDWVWLAARTSEKTVPPHAGITIFLLPMHTPGISIVRHRALSGEISCTVTYDRVRVSDSARIGAVDGGWRVITDAMAGERVSLGSVAAALHRQLDELLQVVRERPMLAGGRGSAARASLAKLAADIQATRVLVSAGVAATGSFAAARLHAPMAKVLSGETAEAFAEATIDILGADALLGAGVDGVPGRGWFDYGLRLAVMYVVGGGTNDVLRGEIARALGLPRW